MVGIADRLKEVFSADSGGEKKYALGHMYSQRLRVFILDRGGKSC